MSTHLHDYSTDPYNRPGCCVQECPLVDTELVDPKEEVGIGGRAERFQEAEKILPDTKSSVIDKNDVGRRLRAPCI